MISDAIMVSKWVILLAHTAVFNNNIREWGRQTTDHKMGSHYKLFFQRSHQEQRRALTTSVKGGYTSAMKNIYDVPSPPP